MATEEQFFTLDLISHQYFGVPYIYKFVDLGYGTPFNQSLESQCEQYVPLSLTIISFTPTRQNLCRNFDIKDKGITHAKIFNLPFSYIDGALSINPDFSN